MHIANYCANDIHHMKTINNIKSTVNHLNKFLLASAWCFLCYLIILQKALLADLTLNVLLFSSSGKQFPSLFLNKITCFHMHISISACVIPLCCRYQVVLLCTCKEYVKTRNSWLFSHITILPLTPVYC